jgi:hypothetical protein
LDACLRQAVLECSNNSSVDPVQAAARARFLQVAANPGLDIAGSPYLVAKEWALLLEVLVCSFRYTGVPSKLRLGPLVKLSSDRIWKVSSLVDDLGTLHRYITVDHWDQSSYEREIHSWWAVGDMAAMDRPMTIHITEIGQMRKGERQSLWVRGWKHPGLPNLKVRFRNQDNRPFKGWRAVRLVNHPEVDIEDWVARIWEDGAGRDLVHMIEVAQPTESERTRVLQDMLIETVRMRNLVLERASTPWSALPMHRTACDGIIPCHFKPVCYEGADLATSEFYIPRQLSEADKSATDGAGLAISKKSV